MRSLSSDYADGIGFVFSNDDDLCGFDIDDCRNPETEAILGWAWEIIRLFDTYTEVSPSGTGVKGFLYGKLPGKGGPKIVGEHAIELYDRGRFFAVTGQYLEGTLRSVAERQSTLDELLPDRSTQTGSTGPSRSGRS